VQQFDRIAADQNSPWHTIAPYLAARAFIRKATVFIRQATVKEGEADVDTSALQEAQQRLLKLINDSRRKEMHPAATQMLALVEFKLNPQERIHQLGKTLSGPAPDPNWLQDMADYRFGWSHRTPPDKAQPNSQAQATANAEPRDDLSDWINTFQSKDKDSGQYAVSRWRKDHALPWLVAAVSKVNAGETGAGEVAQAASKIAVDSPAYPTVTYHRMRLLMQAHQFRPALALYEQVVPRMEKTLTASSLNLFRNLRIGLATSPQDLFAHAALPMLDISQGEESDYEIWNRQCGEGEKCPAPVDVIHDKLQPKDESRFTTNSAFPLNTGLPVAMLAQGVQGQELPAKLRSELAVSTWTRAVLLKNFETADAMVPVIAKGFPETAEALKAYSAASPADKGHAALFLMLHFPGMRPYVNSGLPRSTEISKIDSFRDNWWCEKSLEGAPSSSVSYLDQITPPEDIFPNVSFLSPQQAAAVNAERKALDASGAGPNYLTGEVLKWAKENPDDPRVPEALHLAVRSTRYGCNNNQTTQLSKQAFEVLHKRYPNSTWTKQTPYWY